MARAKDMRSGRGAELHFCKRVLHLSPEGVGAVIFAFRGSSGVDVPGVLVWTDGCAAGWFSRPGARGGWGEVIGL